MKEQLKAATAVLLVVGLAYVVYAQMSGKSIVPGFSLHAPPPEPDTSKLEELKDVASVQAAQVFGGAPDYDMGGRNLFQYGPPKPPPPTPAQIEAMRKAEEARLKAMEEEARRRAEEAAQRAAEENARRAREAQEAAERQKLAQQAQPPQPAQPPPKPPPPVNLKFVGYLGPPASRIAVFLSGKDVVLGKKGDVLEGKFKVVSMAAESVEMGYVDPAHAGVTKKIEMGP
jgi:type IV secretory pathway VirB10-like protein